MAIVDLSKMVPEKYLVLGIFIVFTLNNGFAWLMFEPVADTLMSYFNGLSESQLHLLSSWQPTVFIIMTVPIMKIVTRYDGLRFAVKVGATAEMAGSTLKMIGAFAHNSPAGLVFLHMGQILSGVGSPVATGAVSALSATWFAPEERTRATAAAVMFNTVGNAVCYLIVPNLTAGINFTAVTVYEVIMAIIAGSLVWLVMPQERAEDDAGANAQDVQITANDAPAESIHSPSDLGSGEEVPVHKPKEHAGLRKQVVELLKNPSCVCLCIIYAWLCGGFAAWISLFAVTYTKQLGEQFIGWMSFSGMSMYVLGGLLSSYIVELYFTRQMKYVIFFCITMNTLSNLIFIACTPNDHGFTLWNLGKGFVIFSTGLCGFWNGAAAPLFYELVAEISFPVEEGVSGISISICENLGALLLYQVIARAFKGQAVSVAYSFGMTVAVALCAAVKQRYNRTYHTYLVENAQAS